MYKLIAAATIAEFNQRLGEHTADGWQVIFPHQAVPLTQNYVQFSILLYKQVTPSVLEAYEDLIDLFKYKKEERDLDQFLTQDEPLGEPETCVLENMEFSPNTQLQGKLTE